MHEFIKISLQLLTVREGQEQGEENLGKEFGLHQFYVLAGIALRPFGEANSL